MAKIYGQLEEAQLQNKSSDPTLGVDGKVWLNTTSSLAKIDIGSAAHQIVTHDQTQTLTNKTVVAASNTITTAASGNLSAVELNAALAELQTDIDSRSTAAAVTDHLNDASDAHDASAISFAAVGTIAATDAQTAIAEVATDAASALSSHEADTSSIHGITDTTDLLTTSNTKTLTNKTFDADGTGNSITNIENADIKAAAAIALDKLAATTASRALVSDGSGFVSAATTTATEIGYVNGVTSAIQTQMNLKAPAASPTFSGTITTPLTASRAVVLGASSELAAATTTATEIGYVNGVTSAIQTQLDAKIAKTLTTTTGDTIYASSANTPARLAIGSSGQVLTVVAGVPAWSAASGGSGSGINYCSPNGDAELNATTGWANFADAAASSPVDLTGGSPTTVIAVSSSSPLRGTYSYTWVKSAANRQGEGVSFDFTIDAADKGKMINVSFDYLISSGTYVDNDMGIWIYDVTNATLIQPAPYNILNTGVAATWSGVFQAASNSTSYRVGFYVQSTSASAYTLQWDNFSVGPQIKSIGPAMTDWVAYTPTFTGFGTVASSAFYSRRVGDKLEVRGRLVAGTTTATEARISLGYNGANNNVTIGSNVNTTEVVGPGYYDINASIGIAVLAEPSVAYLTFGIQDGTHSGLTKVNANVLVGTGSGMSFFASVPIVGWSSNLVMSSDADTRVVAARYTSSASQSIPDNTVTPIDFATKEYDTHGMFTAGVSYNSGAGTWSTNPKITIPVPGKYQFRVYILTNGEAWTAGNIHSVRLYKNGSLDKYLSYDPLQASLTTNVQDAVAVTASAVAGDVFDIRYVHNRGGAVVFQNSGTFVWVEVERLSGPAQIAASESVNARYYASATSISASLATIVWSTKDFDSHDAMSSGVYTVPVSGVYQVNVGLTFNFTQITNNDDQIEVQKNGTAVFSRIDFATTGNAGAKGYAFGGLVRALAGDTIRVQALSNQTTPTIRSSNLWNYMTISKVGNY